MLKKYQKNVFMMAFCGLVSALPFTSFAVPVDVELALLVDVSHSIDTGEYQTQKQGYVNAFRNPTLIENINSGAIGSIAVTYIEWGSSNQQQVVVGWTEIFDTESANNFADDIDNSFRSFTNSNTAPGSALNFSIAQFGTETGGAIGNGFESTRQVIDVSGDGPENDGANTTTARDAALLAGIDSINGLPILDPQEAPNIDMWYSQNIVGGDNAFLIVANGFDNFGEIVSQKINLEITGGPELPEPTTLALFAIGTLGIAMRRKARHLAS